LRDCVLVGGNLILKKKKKKKNNKSGVKKSSTEVEYMAIVTYELIWLKATPQRAQIGRELPSAPCT